MIFRLLRSEIHVLEICLTYSFILMYINTYAVDEKDASLNDRVKTLPGRW